MYGFKCWIIPIIVLIVLIATIGLGIYQLNSGRNPWDFGGDKTKEKTSNRNTEDGEMTNFMSDVERESVVFGTVSQNHKYYHAVRDTAEHIKEMSIYDEELDLTFIIHITLPPNYDQNISYPMYVMTDGIWRLTDHRELRPMMVNGEIGEIILISIGYDYEIDAEAEGTRLFLFVKESALFLDFITNNLAPYIGELYNIDYSRCALMGHSLSGLFVYYAVFNHDKYENAPFNYYVMASPSFFIPEQKSYGWKHGDIEKEYFRRNNKLDKRIYLTIGDNEGFSSTLPDIRSFMARSRDYGITTIDYEIYKGDHSSYVKPMLRKSLIKFYVKACG